MKERKINPRFLEFASRQRNEGFLENEARKEAEARRFFEEREKMQKEDLAKKRLTELELKGLDEKQKAEYRTYLNNINNFKGDELETSFYSFVTNPDFPRIFNQLTTIEKIIDKWAFLLRRAYEIGQETQLFIGWNFQYNSINIKKGLEDYGIYLLCPYFKADESSPTKEICLIDKEEIYSLCGGQYESCVVFNDRATKAATGMFKLPVINRPEPKFKIPYMKVEPVDLEDLDDWWKMEGKYG